jgi:hypothetical protein
MPRSRSAFDIRSTSLEPCGHTAPVQPMRSKNRISRARSSKSIAPDGV